MPRNTTSSLIKQNFLLLFFLSVALGLFLPLHSAWALVFLPALIASAIILGILQLFVIGSILFFELAEELLQLVLSPYFINVPYTTNEFVTHGWTLTRDFANMFFIIVLVIIGLATALRISEYQWQKTLPLLIGVALLINFTPVILGLIIDASNIIMNFFVEGIPEGTFFAARAGVYVGSIFRMIRGMSLTDPAGILGILLIPIFFTIFNLIAAVIYLLFAVLLMMRYVALWMLVILSPIAFLCYILPGTRGVFSMWWKQFIQWCIIGITCAFFLYLGNVLFFSIPALITKPDQVGWELINLLIPYSIVLAFLFIGFFVALSASAMGTSGVIGLAQKGTKMAGARAVKTAERRLVGPAAGKIAEKIAATARKTEKWGEKTKWAKPLGWSMRGIEMATVSPLTEYAAKQRRIKKPGGWDQMTISEKTRHIQGLSMASDQLILASEMKGEGTFQKSGIDFQENILKAVDKFKTDSRYLKEVGDIFDALPDKITKKIKIDFELASIPEAEKAEEKQKIEKAINQIMQEFGVDENKAAGVLHAQELKSKDISGVAKGSVKSLPFQLAMRNMKSPQMQAVRNSFDSETVKAVFDEGAGLNTITEDEFKVIQNKNPDLARWAYRTPAGKETLVWSEKWPTRQPLSEKKEKPKIIIPGKYESVEKYKKPPGTAPSP